MNRIIAVVGILLSFSRVYADQTVLSDDGREVRLRNDGTWEYVSNDRFATSEEGKRIRLQSDGRWVEIKDDRNWIAIPAQALQQSRDVVTEGEFEVELSEVRIESVRTKKKKNSRLRSQIVVTLKISSATDSKLQLDVSAFSLTDSRGRSYPLVALEPGHLSLTPGAAGTFTMIGDGSPRWWGIKFLRLQIEAGVLGQSEVELTKSMSEITKLEVEALTQPRP
jgi:hypothetical protein